MLPWQDWQSFNPGSQKEGDFRDTQMHFYTFFLHKNAFCAEWTDLNENREDFYSKYADKNRKRQRKQALTEKQK